jgi:hypothetical protein
LHVQDLMGMPVALPFKGYGAAIDLALGRLARMPNHWRAVEWGEL